MTSDREDADRQRTIRIEESGRVGMADSVIADLKRFNKLCQIEPPLSIPDLAFRMVWTVKEVRWLLKKIRDGREKVQIAERNEAILKMRERGLTFGQIARDLNTTKGVVAGIVARNRERIGLGR